MTPVEQQLEMLKAATGCAQARLEVVGGVSVVVVPDFPLTGWSKPTTTIRFVLPPGYPFGNPDCFFADLELRLGDRRVPQSTAFQPIPGTAAQFLWFSWHPQTWNPNRDSLVTYMKVIQKRLEELK